MKLLLASAVISLSLGCGLFEKEKNDSKETTEFAAIACDISVKKPNGKEVLDKNGAPIGYNYSGKYTKESCDNQCLDALTIACDSDTPEFEIQCLRAGLHTIYSYTSCDR